MNCTSLSDIGVRIPEILLPEGTDERLWACIACDQYTSQPDVWEAIDRQVGQAPSTLRLVLPETELARADVRVPLLHTVMEDYARRVLTKSIHGMMLTARTTPSGCRKGLLLAVDLEEYDYTVGSHSRIRATEGTILSRIPPRMQVRRGALLESPHIMLLADDRERTLIEPLYEKLHGTCPVYDTDLMLDWGHLTGWVVTSPSDLSAITEALLALDASRGEAPLFAVGDGNHSLASAKAVWEELKSGLSPELRQTHPARWALCEVVNLYDEALVFAPIHRVLSGIEHPQELLDLLRDAADSSACRVEFCSAEASLELSGLPLETLQPVLDAYLRAHPAASVDYVHGEGTARTLGSRPGCCALLPEVLDKFRLFPAISRGPLPRKAFSMGQAGEKRCYFECRRIR